MAGAARDLLVVVDLPRGFSMLCVGVTKTAGLILTELSATDMGAMSSVAGACANSSLIMFMSMS